MQELFDYLKQNGPWAVQLGVVGYMLWRAAHWFGTEIAEPLVKDLRSLIQALATGALTIRDDVHEIRPQLDRIEQRQKDQLAACAAAGGRPFPRIHDAPAT